MLRSRQKRYGVDKRVTEQTFSRVNLFPLIKLYTNTPCKYRYLSLQDSYCHMVKNLHVRWNPGPKISDYNAITIHHRHPVPVLTVLTPNNFECQGQIIPSTIPNQIIPRYTYKPNLAIVGLLIEKLLSDNGVSG